MKRTAASTPVFWSAFLNEQLVTGYEWSGRRKLERKETMPEFTQHTIESAAKASKQTLRAAERRYGFVPNLMAIMAESPALLKAYAGIGDIFARSSLSPIEQQVVILTVSQLNECTYCMAAHSMAAKMVGLQEAELEALRDGSPLADPKLEALRAFASAVVQELGWVSEEQIDGFLAAGFEREQVLDVLVVQAGHSGSGSMLIQVAKAVGAEVATTVRNAEKAEVAARAGADLVINTSESVARLGPYALGGAQ